MKSIKECQGGLRAVFEIYAAQQIGHAIGAQAGAFLDHAAPTMSPESRRSFHYKAFGARTFQLGSQAMFDLRWLWRKARTLWRSVAGLSGGDKPTAETTQARRENNLQLTIL